MPESSTGLCPQTTSELRVNTPPLGFHMKMESGELICKVWGLLLEGMILASDPVSDELDWIPVEGCMGDLSRVEVTSAKELSELVLHPWEWKARRAPWVKRGEEEGMESSPPTDDNGQMMAPLVVKVPQKVEAAAPPPV